MQRDAVETYEWMSGAEFLNAVALGQVTPGPVTHTVAVVGYAAAGFGGALLATAIAFAPSFLFVLAGARHFEQIRKSATAQAFLGGAGPAAIGAIIGVSIPLAMELNEPWQWGVLAAAAISLLAFRLGVVLTLLACGIAGAAGSCSGRPCPEPGLARTLGRGGLSWPGWPKGPQRPLPSPAWAPSRSSSFSA